MKRKIKRRNKRYPYYERVKGAKDRIRLYTNKEDIYEILLNEDEFRIMHVPASGARFKVLQIIPHVTNVIFIGAA